MDKAKFLIVEDNAIAQEALLEMASILDIEADIAPDAKTALSLYSSSYHLILMDIDLPDLNGIQITKIIRAIEKNHQLNSVPIVAMTSHNGEEDIVEQCLSAGMNEALEKPNMKMLKTFIEKYVETV